MLDFIFKKKPSAAPVQPVIQGTRLLIREPQSATWFWSFSRLTDDGLSGIASSKPEGGSLMSKQSKLNAGGSSRLSGGVSNIPLYAGMFQGRPFRGLLHEVAEFGLPSNGLLPIVNRWRFHNFKNLWHGLYKVLLLDAAGLPGIFGKLSLAGYIGAGGLWLPFGLASMRVVTTAGVNYLVDALQNLVEPENLRYHALGTTRILAN